MTECLTPDEHDDLMKRDVVGADHRIEEFVGFVHAVNGRVPDGAALDATLHLRQNTQRLIGDHVRWVDPYRVRPYRRMPDNLNVIEGNEERTVVGELSYYEKIGLLERVSEGVSLCLDTSKAMAHVPKEHRGVDFSMSEEGGMLINVKLCPIKGAKNEAATSLFGEIGRKAARSATRMIENDEYASLRGIPLRVTVTYYAPEQRAEVTQEVFFAEKLVELSMVQQISAALSLFRIDSRS